MRDENTPVGAPREPDRRRASSLALRIRRAAQMASRAKAKANTANQVVIDFPLPPGVQGPQPAPEEAKPKRPRKDGRAGSGEPGTAFQRYLRSLHSAEVLPPAEERALATRYRDSGDADAAGRLV